MRERYEHRRVHGDAKWSTRNFTLNQIMEVVKDRQENHGKPFRRRRKEGEWIGWQRLAIVFRRRFRAALDATPPGDKGIWQYQVGGPNGPIFAIRKELIPDANPKGGVVAEAALSQVGVDYSFGAANPEGPEGGAGAGFDCSGLTQFANAQVGVSLPHSAEMQRTDPRMNRFTDRSKLREGDFIFYDASDRLGPGQADHVGVYVGNGMVCDASSGLDKVVKRPMDSNPILVFGYIEAVTGKH